MKTPRLIATHSYWAGEWLDLWSVPHLLFGFIVIFVCALLGIEMTVAYGITATLALLWELFERLSGIGSSETATNSLADISLALVGFALGLFLLSLVTGESGRIVVLGLLIIVWGTANILGWLAYRHHALASRTIPS